VTGTVAVNMQERQAFDSAVSFRPCGCARVLRSLPYFRAANSRVSPIENAGLAFGTTAAAIRALSLLQVLTARVRRWSESLISWQCGKLD